MKNLLALLVITFFTSTSFAQDNKSTPKQETKASDVKYTHECYWMKDGALLHCMGDKKEPVKADVKLSNGTTISPTGMLSPKGGTKTQLENGQCVSLMGGIGSCDEMHAAKSDTPGDVVK